MPELTLKLVVDPETGKKTLVADYASDSDALPHEHEEEHRQYVRKLLEGAPLDDVETSGLTIEREQKGEAGATAESTDGLEEASPAGEKVAVEQKG